MAMRTRSKYTRELERLDGHVVVLGRAVVDDVNAVGRGLAEGDAQAMEEVVEGHDASERLRRSVEDSCMSMILLEHPLARDLRLVTAAFRAISDLSRIDEMCYQTALVCKEEGIAVDGTLAELFGALAKAVAQMVGTSMDAFLNEDADKAETVFGMDDTVDDLFSQVRAFVVAELKRGTSKADKAPEVLMVAKYFERMGDHAQSIADWAIFRATGSYKGDQMGTDPGSVSFAQ